MRARLASCWNTASASAGELGVGGEVADVGVQARGLRVVVAGRQVRVARSSRRACLAARDEQQLGVRLQPDDAVHHLRAHRLEPLGPVDVGLLVEARLQLDHRHHFLAAPRRLDQQVHQRRLAAGAVDGLLDRQHVGVVHRLAQELHHRLEATRTGGAAARRLRAGARRSTAGAAAGPAASAGSYGGKRSAGASAWSMSWFSRTRFTGPLTRYSAASGRSNCCSRNSDSSGGQVFTTSSRIAWPKWRVVRPVRSAWRRLVTSSSSTSRSESRVTRNCENASTVAARETARRGARGSRWSAARRPACRRRSVVGQADHARQHARHLDDGDRVLAPEGVAAGRAAR